MSAGNNTMSTDRSTGPTSNTISSIISSISSVHSTSSAPATTSAPPSSTAPETHSVFVTTQVSVVSGQAPSTYIAVATSTSLLPTSTDAAASTSSSSSSPGYANGGSGGGDSSTHVGTIVPAVVVPVAVVALLVAGAIWFFRKRRLNKENEVRRKEAEEYGFNPNTDMAAGGDARGMATNDNAAAMSEADGTGYRGWGTTTSARKASTTLGSASVGAAAIGLARSDSGENGGFRGGQHSPTGANGGASYSDHNSGDPLVNGGSGSRPISRDFEGVAALGTAPAAGSRTNTGVHRGPSNASSAYSTGQRSDTSGEGVNGFGSPTWGNEYGGENGNYGGQDGAPVIRDVSARRNTRIEQPSVMPQQARGGISQNF